MRPACCTRPSAAFAGITLALALLSGAPVTMAQSVTAYAQSYASDDFEGWSIAFSDKPGERVAQSSSATSKFPNVDLGIARGTSEAQSDFGVSRIGVTGQNLSVNTSTAFGYAYVASTAQSQWNDTWTINGGNAGDPVSLLLRGRVRYELALGGGMTLDRLRLDGGISVSGIFESALLLFEFTSAPGAQAVDWTLSVDSQAGSSVNVSSGLLFFGGLLGVGRGFTNETYAFDAMHTARLTGVTITDGYSISALSGDLVPHGEGFSYRAAIADMQVATVPLPAGHLLFVAGLAVLIGSTRERGRHARRNPPERTPAES